MLSEKQFSNGEDYFKLQLNDEEYAQMMDIFRSLPWLNIDVNVRVEDDESENQERFSKASCVWYKGD